MHVLETFAPLALQEGYDNAGLYCGEGADDIQKVMVCLDVTEQVIDEAISSGCDLVIAHHPVVFKPIKRLTGAHYTERILLKAIRHRIALYAAHTNLDNVLGGVNYKLAEKLRLNDVRILQPSAESLRKLVVFVPVENTDGVLAALGKAGAGQIGNYKNCSFRTEGKGSFLPNEEAQPFIGQQHVQEEVDENRIEVVFPKHITQQVLRAMRDAHPYEEVAYYLQEVLNANQESGAGAIGVLEREMSTLDFLAHLKQALDLKVIKHTHFERPIRRVAVCGGSGSFLLSKAMAQGADVFVSSDFKYHEFFEADNKIMVADVGHYESEQYTKELIVEILAKQLPELEMVCCKTVTNPVAYFADK